MKDIQDIKVSIVVAIFKSAPFLDKGIQSIIHQTHQNLEIILVDDGSPDESGKICDKYAKQDDRIIVIHQPNSGCCNARNNGMKRITGEYFTLMDGDDWLAEDYIEYLLKLAVSMNTDMAMSDVVFTTRDLVQVETDNIERWPSEKATEDILIHQVIGPWNKLYKMEMINKANLSFNVPWAGEGMYFSTMSSQYSRTVAKGHRKIYYYRMNNQSSCLSNYRPETGINALWNTRNLLKVLPDKTRKVKNAVKLRLWINYNFLITQIVGSHSIKKYLKEYLSCYFGLWWMSILFVFRADFSLKQKWSFIKHSFFPIHYAKAQILINGQQMEADSYVD